LVDGSSDKPKVLLISDLPSDNPKVIKGINDEIMKVNRMLVGS
jgi:hypothetical protein